MVRSLNKVMVIGQVGRAPEMRFMPSGRPVTSFSVGAARAWTDADGHSHEETEWFNVVAWGDLAERCREQLQQADQVYVEGRLQTRSWETEEGDSRYRSELVAHEAILLSRPGQNEAAVAESAEEQ